MVKLLLLHIAQHGGINKSWCDYQEENYLNEKTFTILALDRIILESL